MTLHLTFTWLWVTLGIIWSIGVIASCLILQVLYMDSEPRWYVKLLPLVWPLAIPAGIVVMLVRAFSWD